MKVLKNNYNQTDDTVITNQIEPYPRNFICDSCGSELEYEESDMRMGFLGCMYVDCPLCGCDNMLDDNEKNIILTADNIEFPIHFWHVSKEVGAVDCCNTKEIREYIHRAINYFRENKEECDWGYHVGGNLYINVHRYSGDRVYEVTVSNNFYEVEIPFEHEDY